VIIKPGFFFAHPFNEFDYFFVLVQALNGMVMPFEFRPGKNCMDFIVANLV
jgi:hypothetical protein